MLFSTTNVKWVVSSVVSPTPSCFLTNVKWVVSSVVSPTPSCFLTNIKWVVSSVDSSTPSCFLIQTHHFVVLCQLSVIFDTCWKTCSLSNALQLLLHFSLHRSMQVTMCSFLWRWCTSNICLLCHWKKLDNYWQACLPACLCAACHYFVYSVGQKLGFSSQGRDVVPINMKLGMWNIP